MSDETESNIYPASVVKVIDEYTVVINKGSDHNVSKEDQFLVYYIDPEELTDPETGESLGNLEVVRGTGSVIHVQPKLSTIKSNRSIRRGRIIRRTKSNLSLGLLSQLASPERETVEEPENEAIPFDDPTVGDKVKPI